MSGLELTLSIPDNIGQALTDQQRAQLARLVGVACNRAFGKGIAEGRRRARGELDDALAAEREWLADDGDAPRWGRRARRRAARKYLDGLQSFVDRRLS